MYNWSVDEVFYENHSRFRLKAKEKHTGTDGLHF